MSAASPSDRAPLCDPRSETPPASMVPSAWRAPLLAVVLLWVWILFLFRDTAAGMVAIWARSDTFAHGFFVLPISLWLMWRQRARLWEQPPRPNPWILVAMALCTLLWLPADMVSANAPAQLALVALLVLTVPCLWGLRSVRVLMFPLGFLFFAVPLGEFMLEPLMEGTATFTVLALRASGIPVYREGMQFVIPSGAWSVVEACSGVRYLIASLTVGTLYAHLNYRSAKRRWLFIGVSILVPIVANWLRAYLIVLLGHLTNNRLAAGADHLIYGWLFFGIVIFLMFMIGARWADADTPSTLVRPSGLAPTGVPAGRLAMTALAAAVLMLLPVWASHRLALALDVPGPRLQAPEHLSPHWVRVAQAPTDWSPGFQNPSSTLQVGYENGSRAVGLYVGYYRNQHEDRKLVSSSNTLTPDAKIGWSRAAVRTLRLEQPSLDVRATELRDSPVPGQSRQQRLLVWQWYWVGGRWMADDRLAKAYGAAQRLFGQGDESAVVIVYTLAGDDAAATLRGFVQANLAPLQEWLQQAKAQ